MKNKQKRTIPLLALQISLFNAFPSKRHKDALASLRANLAEAAYRASQPKTRERK
jgi:hypothetical protein